MPPFTARSYPPTLSLAPMTGSYHGVLRRELCRKASEFVIRHPGRPVGIVWVLHFRACTDRTSQPTPRMRGRSGRSAALRRVSARAPHAEPEHGGVRERG